MIQVFDTHRLPYRNAVIKAFKLKSDNVTEPAQFYDFTDYVKNTRDIEQYAIGYEVYTNASGYICRASDMQTVLCLGLKESAIVRVSLDGGKSWKIQWTVHGSDDMLSADDFGRLLYADGSVCFDPLQPGDTELKDFVTSDRLDLNLRWEEDSVVALSDDGVVEITDWTSVICVSPRFVPDTLKLTGTLRAGQKIVVTSLKPSVMKVTLGDDELGVVSKESPLLVAALNGGGRPGGFAVGSNFNINNNPVSGDAATLDGVYAIDDDSHPAVVNVADRTAVVANSRTAPVSVRTSFDGATDLRRREFAVVSHGHLLRPCTSRLSLSSSDVSGSNDDTVTFDLSKYAGSVAPDILKVHADFGNVSMGLAYVDVVMPDSYFDGMRTVLSVTVSGLISPPSTGKYNLYIRIRNSAGKFTAKSVTYESASVVNSTWMFELRADTLESVGMSELDVKKFA